MQIEFECGRGSCLEGHICCPASQECVPRDCSGCCEDDDYHRSGRDDTPPASGIGSPDPGSPDPGPMPPD